MFEYPDPTLIIGKPTTASLLTFIKEVCPNISSVHSDLGGSKDNCLDSVCMPEIYTTSAPDAVV